MKSSSGYFIVVIEDVALEKVVGAATLLVEKKFIHECGQVVIILWMHLIKYGGRTYSNIVASGMGSSPPLGAHCSHIEAAYSELGLLWNISLGRSNLNFREYNDKNVKISKN